MVGSQDWARAKPKQSLRGHTEDVCQVMRIWLENHPQLVEQVCHRLGVDSDELEGFLHLAAFTHDLGKSSLLWQERLDDGGRKHDVSHPLLSMMIVDEVIGKKEKSSLLYVPFQLAILAHHYMLHDNSYEKYERDITPIELHDNLQLLLQEGSEVGKLPLQSLPAKRLLKQKEGVKLLKRLKKDLKDLIKQKIWSWWEVKACYTFFLRLLMQADQCASEIEGKTSRADFDMPAVNLGDTNVQQILKKWIPDIRKLFNPADEIPDRGGWWHTPRPMQMEVQSNIAPYMIIHDACGGGKTGAALTWARTLFEQGRIDRLIFTLPTKFTTNSMFRSLADKHGVDPEQMGIYHGEARVFLSGVSTQKPSGHEDQEELDIPQVEQENWIADQLFLNTFYHKPVTISTIDHLIYSLLHCYKYSDRAFGYVVTSGIVFDELHYYDAYTMKRIGEALDLLRKLKIPHLVMSATMPETFLQKLNEEATAYGGEGYVLVQGKACVTGTDQEKVPARIVKMDVPMFEGRDCHFKLRELIADHATMKQMVVVNWVERAKTIYRMVQEMKMSNDRLKDIEVVCYHSELTRGERELAEEKILALFKENKPCILISTQLCEMSLDISADVMFTEIAPLDAIGQRGGRLHRNGNAPLRSRCGCEFCQNRLYLADDHVYTIHVFPLPFEEPKQLAPYDRELLDHLNRGNKREPKRFTDYLRRSFELLPSQYSFSLFCSAINELYRNQSFELRDAEMKKFMEEDMIFGALPRERYVSEETGEGASTGFAVRLIDFPKVDVIPISCLEMLKEDCLTILEKTEANKQDELLFKLVETIKRYQVSVGVSKKKSYLWKRRQEGYYDDSISEPKTLLELLDHLQMPPVFLLEKYKGMTFEIVRIPYESGIGFNFQQMELDEDPSFQNIEGVQW